MKHLSAIIFFFASLSCFSQVKYEIYADAKLLEVSRNVALSQIGVIEKYGRNDHPKIAEYLKSVGLSPGNPYCAASVYYCFFKAAEFLHMSLDSIPIYRSGSANMIFDKAKIRGIKRAYYASSNDLIIWKSANSYSGHIERVLYANDRGNVVTIAFNSSEIINGVKKEGVFIKKRNIYSAIDRLKVRGLIGFRS